MGVATSRWDARQLLVRCTVRGLVCYSRNSFLFLCVDRLRQKRTFQSVKHSAHAAPGPRLSRPKSAGAGTGVGCRGGVHLQLELAPELLQSRHDVAQEQVPLLVGVLRAAVQGVSCEIRIRPAGGRNPPTGHPCAQACSE